MVMHFSVDDFIDAFLDLRNEKYQSLFEQPTFALLKRIHESCGAVFSCYCFYESGNGNLAEVPEDYAEEFQENGEWLRFGFHAYNTNSNYGSQKFTNGDWITDGETAAKHYECVMKELIRITGGGKCIDRFPRIHYYAGTLEDCKAWQQAEYGILGLITAEDNRICYYHDEAQWTKLIQKGVYQDEQQGIGFWRTCIRLENMKDAAMLEDALNRLNVSNCVEQQAYVEESDSTQAMANYLVFTHEKFLKEQRIADYFIRCGEVAKEKHIPMGYFY